MVYKVSIIPSTVGLATIHDKDILIYCISQLITKMNAGLEPHRTLHIKAHDLLVSTNRNIDGMLSPVVKTVQSLK